MYNLNNNFSLAPISNHIDSIEQMQSTDDQTTCIYFVRHGESLCNVPNEHNVKLVSGRGIEVPLTSKGQRQAIQLAKKLSVKLPNNGEYVFLSSTALRAKDTAEQILAELSHTHSTLRGEDYSEFCEQGKGDWEGKLKDENYEYAQKEWKLLSAKDKFSCPSVSMGESLKDVSERMLEGLRQAMESHRNKTIIIVTHNMALNTLAFVLRGHIENLSETQKTPFPMTSLRNCDLLMMEIPSESSIDKAQIKMHIQS